MRIAVLGTGSVGQALATRLVELGHEVAMGARRDDNETGRAWVAKHAAGARSGSFRSATEGAELVFLCTLGSAALEVLEAAGRDQLAGKVLVDVTNPLDFAHGMPPSLFTGPRESLGERIQRAFPETRVVKSLHTVNAAVMVDPARIPGEHVVFVAGEDPDAKERVTELLRSFGWKSVLDLGGIDAARATEAYLLLWVRLWGTQKTVDFNIQIARR